MKKVIVLCITLSLGIIFASSQTSILKRLENIRKSGKKFCDEMFLYYRNYINLSEDHIIILRDQCYANIPLGFQAIDNFNTFGQAEKKRWKEYYHNVQNQSLVCPQVPITSVKKLIPSQRQIEAQSKQFPSFSIYEVPQLLKWAHSKPEFVNDSTTPLLLSKLGYIIFKPSSSSITGLDYAQAEKVGFSFNENNRFKPGEFVIAPAIDGSFILAVILGRPRFVDLSITTREEILVDPDILNQDGLYILGVDNQYNSMRYDPNKIGKMSFESKNWLINVLPKN